MNKQDIEKNIPQLPGESDASYYRLILFILSDCQDLKEFEVYLAKEHPKKAVVYNTLTYNSAKDNWTQRIQKFIQLKDEELQEELEQLFKDLNTQGIHDMKQFLDELNEVKNAEMELFRKGPKKPRSVIFTLRQYIKCYREATEVYYINTRHNLIPNEQENNKEVNDKKLEDFGKIINGV